MSRWIRPLAGVALIAVVLHGVGTSPVLDGLRSVGPGSLAAAAALGAVATVCYTWRWQLVAGRLGVAVPFRGGVRAYYRSQFLNLTMPGGVLGDVHRAVRHGREVADMRRTARSVALERCAGQAVQLVLAVGLLLCLSQTARHLATREPCAVLGVLIPVALAAVGGLAVARHGARAVLTHLPTIAGVAACSALGAAAHALTFLVAARAIGTGGVPASRLVPAAVVVLAASAVPLNVAGWGPREWAAAWAFGWAGMGASQGVAVSVTYGVLALAASLPGAIVLVLDRSTPQPKPRPQPIPGPQLRPRLREQLRRRRPVAGAEAVVHG